MIAHIKGILTVISDEFIIVDVHGIGYEIICANPFVFQDSMNEEVLIHTYHHVRDDAQLLYGFKTMDEKHLFMKLISVSGIGPKSSLGILGHVNVNDFVAAVEQEDKKYLMSFPGVGKKTAQQIILDLKGKLTNFVSVKDQEQLAPLATDQQTKALEETAEALKTLGYKQQEIQVIMPELQKSTSENTDELIREALILLAN